MAISTVGKNFRDGVILIEDGTGTPLAVTVIYENGDFSGSGFMETQTDVTAYLDRGSKYSLRKTNQNFPTFTFTAHMTDISDATDKLLWDIVNKTNAFSAAVSTDGAAADVYTLNVTLTIEGTDYGDSADHTIVLADCHLTIDVSEGDPNAFSVSGTVYGAVTAT